MRIIEYNIQTDRQTDRLTTPTALALSDSYKSARYHAVINHLLFDYDTVLMTYDVGSKQ